MKGLPTSTAGDGEEKTKAQKDAAIADAANQVRPRPAPHPIPHDKADEAESGRPPTWAERVAAGAKAPPEILQKDGGSPAPRRPQGRLPPLVGPSYVQSTVDRYMAPGAPRMAQPYSRMQ